MSETKHSPEPWKVFHSFPSNLAIGITSEQACVVVSHGMAGVMSGRADANARRIVACVNALAGIPTEALEKGRLVEELRYLGRIP